MIELLASIAVVWAALALLAIGAWASRGIKIDRARGWDLTRRPAYWHSWDRRRRNVSGGMPFRIKTTPGGTASRTRHSSRDDRRRRR